MKVIGVYNFGDKIPAGDDNDYFVSYNVPGVPGGLLSGPYQTKIEANEDMRDIASYDGITNAKLVMRNELMT
jgi:hypothetical protein